VVSPQTDQWESRNALDQHLWDPSSERASIIIIIIIFFDPLEADIIRQVLRYGGNATQRTN
jgi:hypothetical protein